LGAPVVGVVLIRGAHSVEALMSGASGAARDAYGVGVPLGVPVPQIALFLGHSLGLPGGITVQIGPGWQGEQSPVHEDAEFGVPVPLGHLPGLGAGGCIGTEGGADAVFKSHDYSCE